jgi:hypothetical protein
MSHTSSASRSISFLALRTVWTMPILLQAADDERLEQHEGHLLGQPHWFSLRSGPMTMTERPE